MFKRLKVIPVCVQSCRLQQQSFLQTFPGWNIMTLLSTLHDYDYNVADDDDNDDDNDGDDNDDDNDGNDDDAPMFRQPLPSRQGLLRPSPLPRPSW